MDARDDSQRAKGAADIEPESAGDIEATIKGLEGKDKLGSAGEAIATAGGVAAGATAAGAIAGALGATTFLGSTTLGGLVGGVLAVSTPVGWVIGCAVAGGTAAYGVARMIRSGGRQDEVRSGIRHRLRKRLAGLRDPGQDDAELRELRQVTTLAVDQGVLTASNAARMLALVEAGSLPTAIANERVRELVRGANSSSRSESA